MKISYTRSGGVTNIRIHLDLDSKDLSAQEAKDLENLIQRSLSGGVPDDASVSPIPDDLIHDLEITENGVTRKLRIADSAAGHGLQELFDFLYSKAVQRVRKSN